MIRPQPPQLDLSFAESASQLMKGAKQLKYGEYGFATEDGILVVRDLAGCFHFIGEGRCACELHDIGECDVTFIDPGQSNIEDGGVTIAVMGQRNIEDRGVTVAD